MTRMESRLSFPTADVLTPASGREGVSTASALNAGGVMIGGTEDQTP